MSDDDELLSIAKMGIDAESFLRTPLGSFLMDKADAEIMAATAELIGADPEDVKLNREIRNKIHIANMFRTWLRDAIDIGRAAHEQLDDMQ